jgi:hypothetical protein
VALFAEVAVLAVDGGLLDRGSDVLDQAQDLEAEVGAPVWLHARVQQTRGVISVHRGDLDTARSIAVAGLAESTTPIGRAACSTCSPSWPPRSVLSTMHAMPPRRPSS